MNQLEHPANVGKDVSEPSYLDEMLCIAQKCMFLLPKRNKPMPRNALNLRQGSNHTTRFELFILVGLQQTMGLPYLVSIFAGNISL